MQKLRNSIEWRDCTLYDGDLNQRALRDAPYDYSDEVVSHLVLPLSGPHLEFNMNSPSGGRDAQVAGKTTDGFAFRYTRGAGNVEVFSFPVTGVTGLNDDGTFCGCAKIPLSKSRFATEAFIYTNSRQLLTGATTNEAYPTDMNSSKDLVTRYQVYRNDWGWVSLNNLAIGTSADLLRWNTAGYLLGPCLGDRTLIGNGIEAAIVTGGKSGSLVILTPELAK